MADNLINPLTHSLTQDRVSSTQHNLTTDEKRVSDPSKRTELSQESFLKLLITQLKNQDPMNPQDPGQFMSDMAQFGTLSGVSKINQAVGDLVNHFQSHRALQASSMVGRNVRVASQIAHLPKGESMVGIIDVPTKVDDLMVTIYNASGKEIDTVLLKQKEKGSVEFQWDGKDKAGNLQPEGRYAFVATATIGGQPIQMETFVDANVDSVIMDKTNSFVLNLKGIGPVGFDQIQKIDS